MNPLADVTDAAFNGSNGRRIKRSISSKFSSFLSRSSTHINNFSIELDEPVRLHGPGDTVKGTVILNVGKPLGVTHIVACLYGYVQVFKSHSKPNITPRNNANRIVSGQNKRWVAEYYGDGFASLFEEEVVLCGEGRLDPKLYHFRFAIDFPTDLALPSSIDFERGTIHYMVWSTITRPNPIMSTTTCETKVFFRDHIDVASLPPPKPREVTLRAVDPNIKARSGLKRLASYDKKRSSRASTTSKTNQSSRTLESREGINVSRNPSMSLPSSRSSSSSRGRVASLVSELRSSQISISAKRADLDNDNSNHSITVWVEPSTMGCLPGDVVPIFVRVNHIKVVQSLRGVIVTLYRQARVDMHPNLPVVSNTRGRDGQYEDYYPRSRTGLGGLSLSAAGSSQVWRKDLSQAFAPLYIDPSTMSADVKVAVRVPDDAFPSISNVPGEMISFKYFVEVIIDIHGKLGNGDRAFPAISTVNSQPSYPNTPRTQVNETPDYIGVALENDCVDTSTIRREKNAVVVQCDLLVCTKDSEKSRGKKKVIQEYVSSDTTEVGHPGEAPDTTNEYAYANSAGDWNHYAVHNETEDQNGYYDYYYDPNHTHDYNGNYYSRDDEYYHYPEAASNGNALNNYHPQSHSIEPRPSFPLPAMSHDANLSEKERLHRAEQHLLPSQPPFAESGIATHVEYAPSAPVLDEERDMYSSRDNRRTVLRNAPRLDQLPVHAAATDGGSIAPASSTMSVHPRVVLQDDDGDGVGEAKAEDKQELERQGLQARVSAPDAQQGTANEGPSAPSAELTDDVQFWGTALRGHGHYAGRDFDRLNGVAESLPRYER